MYLFVCFSNKNHYYLFEEIIVICIFFKFSHMKVHTCACMYISPNLHFIEQGLYTILFMIIKSDKRTWGWRLTLFKVPLLLLSRFSHVRHWVTPYTAAHHGQRSLAGYSPCGCTELAATATKHSAAYLKAREWLRLLATTKAERRAWNGSSTRAFREPSPVRSWFWTFRFQSWRK